MTSKTTSKYKRMVVMGGRPGEKLGGENGFTPAAFPAVAGS